MNKQKRTKRTARPRPTRNPDRLHHLHTVIDDELQRALENHARKLAGLTPRAKDRPNVSVAVRDLLRAGLGLSAA